MADHPIVHIEIPSTNFKTSSDFYANVFGWKIQSDPTFDYWMFEPASGPGGGFIGVEAPSEAKINEPVIYIGTDDIEASLSEIEAAGGKTMLAKTEIPGTGWFAYFADPAGNRMALYTSMRPQP